MFFTERLDIVMNEYEIFQVRVYQTPTSKANPNRQKV